MSILGDGCFCSAHQDCYKAALEGCALCAGAEMRRITMIGDALLTIEKAKTVQLELDVAALKLEIEDWKAGSSVEASAADEARAELKRWKDCEYESQVTALRSEIGRMKGKEKS